MNMTDNLKQKIQESALTHATLLIDDQLRKRNLIPVSVLKEFRFADENGKELLRNQYGSEPFEMTADDKFMFELHLASLAISSGDNVHSYPIKMKEKEYIVELRVFETTEKPINVQNFLEKAKESFFSRIFNR